MTEMLPISVAVLLVLAGSPPPISDEEFDRFTREAGLESNDTAIAKVVRDRANCHRQQLDEAREVSDNWCVGWPDEPVSDFASESAPEPSLTLAEMQLRDQQARSARYLTLTQDIERRYFAELSDVFPEHQATIRSLYYQRVRVRCLPPSHLVAGAGLDVVELLREFAADASQGDGMVRAVVAEYAEQMHPLLLEIELVRGGLDDRIAGAMLARRNDRLSLHEFALVLAEPHLLESQIALVNAAAIDSACALLPVETAAVVQLEFMRRIFPEIWSASAAAQQALDNVSHLTDAAAEEKTQLRHWLDMARQDAAKALWPTYLRSIERVNILSSYEQRSSVAASALDQQPTQFEVTRTAVLTRLAREQDEIVARARLLEVQP
jgi:hypothetical protein